jgi:chaperonin GroES
LGTIPTLDECKPGFYPVEYNVVIAPEVTETVTKSGLIIPDATKEKEDAAKTWGLLVSASPLAFNFDAWPDGQHPPKSGDIVLYAKYGGTLVTGDDGREYRVLKDKDIALVRHNPNSGYLTGDHPAFATYP